jgi:hypothetical protein
MLFITNHCKQRTSCYPYYDNPCFIPTNPYRTNCNLHGIAVDIIRNYIFIFIVTATQLLDLWFEGRNQRINQSFFIKTINKKYWKVVTKVLIKFRVHIVFFSILKNVSFPKSEITLIIISTLLNLQSTCEQALRLTF